MGQLADIDKMRSTDSRQRLQAIARGRLRRLGRRVRQPVAQATARRRMLPHFLIAGAQRSGTTSLFDWLSDHPQMLPPVVKEVQYFDHQYGRGEGWYRSNFPLRTTAARYERAAGLPMITGDASPNYLWHPCAPERAHALLPDVKILLLLRNPVERAISAWVKTAREGVDPLDFPEAIAAEPERLAGQEELLLAGGPGTRSRRHRAFSYTGRGHYARQIRRWLEHFDREQLLVIQSERMFERPAETFDEICAFLGIEQGRYPSFGALNSNQSGGRPEWRSLLAGVFDDDVAELQELLGQRFDWELPVSSQAQVS